MTKRTQIRGIVVAGNSLEEAQELYRAVATGQDAQALHDEGDTFVVLASASSDINMLNPLTGADDLVVGDGLTEQMEFLSSDSEAVNINYTVCTAGCNAHILADDAELMQFCPACASTLEDLTEEQIAALSAGEEGDEGCDDCVTQESVIACAATLEEAVAAYKSLISGETAPITIKCGDVIVATAGASKFDVYSGCEATVVDHQPASLEAMASTGDELDAHHYVCASSECGSHVISSDDMPVFCPSCSSGLLDPEEDYDAEASSDEDESADNVATAGDEDDEDDEDDIEEIDDEDDEEEDDDSDEDDEDDSDEDEDDSDDDEDDDTSLTLSVSSVQTSKRARNRQEAVASNVEQEEVMTAVAASYLAVAGDLDATKLDVAYAANLQGENTWLAFYNGVPVAKAVASTTKHGEIFNSEVFGRAFKAQANEHGVQAALTQMGFEEIRPEIQIGDYVKAEIDSQVAARTQEVVASAERDKQELTDRFSAAMALAATGLTKGFFKGKVNPIKQSLVESLSSVGIDNAEALVNNAFASKSNEYHKVLLAQASNIMSYGLEVQNQIAEAIASVNDVEEAHASSAPVTLGRPVQVEKEKPVEATASSAPSADFQSKLRSAVGGLGKRI
jgi:hypothetical protein